MFIVARLSKSLATLTLGSSKINQHCWRFHGSGVIAAPQIKGLISFCTGLRHEYFFEVVNVLSCSPFMFENTENKPMDSGVHAGCVPGQNGPTPKRPQSKRPQITRLSQLENSAMGTWPIYKNSIIPDWFEKWHDTGVNCVVPQNYDVCPLLMMHKTCSINYGHLADLQKTLPTTDLNKKKLSFDTMSPRDFYFFSFLFNLYLLQMAPDR